MCAKEKRLSDFHRMTISAPKIQFRKIPPKIINHCGFTKFYNEKFMTCFELALNSQNEVKQNFPVYGLILVRKC